MYDSERDVEKHAIAIAMTCMALDTINLPWIQKVAYTHHMDADFPARRRAAILAAAHPAVQYVNEIITSAGEEDLHSFTVVEGIDGVLNVEHVVRGNVRTVIRLVEADSNG